MEKYEKDAIVESLDFICLNTTGHEQIVVKLIAQNLMGEVDGDEIKAENTPYLRNYAIYRHVMKKADAMTPLLQILRETLNDHIASCLEAKMNELKTDNKSDSEGNKAESSAPFKLNVVGNKNITAGAHVSEQTYNIRGQNVNPVGSQTEEKKDKKTPKKVEITVKGEGNTTAGRNVSRNTYNYNY